jgi:dTDP-glucose 4,6-dehydratase
MRIVIAGAAGFIGCHLARRYLDGGHEVVGVDNLVTGSERNVDWLSSDPAYTFMRADVCEPLEVAGPVDLVCDLACPASPVDFEPLSLEILRVCSDGVRNLLELAREKDAVFLQTSTSEVYGDPSEHPQSETYWGHVNPIGPRSMYDEGKRFAEATVVAFARRHDVSVRLARIFNTYGPRMRLDDGRVVTNFTMQALQGLPLTVQGDGSQTRSFCYVDDTVEGLVRLAASECEGPVNIGNPDEISIGQLAQEVIELAGSSSEVINTPKSADDPARRRPDISMARALLGWEPTISRLEGLQRMIEDCRNILACGEAAKTPTVGAQSPLTDL